MGKARLYRARTKIDALFVLDGGNPDWAAREYLGSEIENNGLLDNDVKVEEITDISQVPENWKGGNLWGAEECGFSDGLTPEQFFDRDENKAMLKEIERHQKAIDELKKKIARTHQTERQR